MTRPLGNASVHDITDALGSWLMFGWARNREKNVRAAEA
jgi:hypothetical protein